MPAIHQLVAGFTNGDAISNEARVMRGIFRGWGCESEVFCETQRILPELRREARDVAECAACCAPGDVALLHLSMGSVVNDAFRSLKCRKALLYHNITPAAHFELINKQTALSLARGREHLRLLAGAAEVNMADSRFNAGELEALGYRDVHVLPLVLDLSAVRAAPDRKILRKFGDGKTNVLFVGRCAPNKRIEDALKAFAYYHRFVNPHSRFIHVGSFAGTERYYYLLLSQARDMGLTEVHFAGAVPQSQLNAFYRCAHLFLCMSDHEGFCIPLLESMVHDVPVLAYAAGAVPETLAGAGALVHRRNFEEVAELMGRMTADATLRQAIIAGQRRRLAAYEGQDLGSELRRNLAPLLAGPGGARP